MSKHGDRAPHSDLVDNPASARITRVAGLTRRRARRKYGRFLAEGPQCVREAVRWVSGQVLDLYATAEAADRHAEILGSAREAGIYIHLVTPAVMEVMSTDTQGLLAVVATDALGAASGEGAGSPSECLTGTRLVAVLTEAQDPGNAGTIIRAADAAGADAIVLAKGSVDPTSPKVVRASAGSIFHLPVLAGEDLETLVPALREVGLQILAADGRGSIGLFASEAEELVARPTAWLLGNEARGLGPEALAEADAVVAIPMYGTAESLNVATAAALCLYASARAQRLAP